MFLLFCVMFLLFCVMFLLFCACFCCFVPVFVVLCHVFVVYVSQFKVSNLADQFTRKLEYLHVSTTSISSLEILSIKLQVSSHLVTSLAGGQGKKCGCYSM